jgi:hypothetical protein
VGLELRFLSFAGLFLSAGSLFSAPFIYTKAVRFDSGAAKTGGERFPAGGALHLVSNGKDTLLVPGFTASADASVSFDGRRILFSGKQKPGDSWQIWEAPVSGGTPRRLVTLAGDCITPFYLPSDRAVFAHRTPRGFELEVIPLSGGKATPLTFGPGNDIVSDVLPDGRVLFESNHASGFRDLYTVYTDGSGVETDRCDHRHDRYAGHKLASGDIVFEAGGRLARFTSARAVEVPLKLPAGEFAGPVAEIAPELWLVAYRSAASAPFALYRWKPSALQPREMLARDAVQPVLVEARERPKIHPSALGNRDGANTLCLSVYTSKQKIAAGSVAKVRVWVQDDRGLPVALGTAPVEKDGSFFVTTPADRPVRFDLLDTAGRTVAGEKGWFWYRRGEQRICVGCHAGPERAVDNVQPQVLLRSMEPVKFTMPVHTASRGTR